MTKPNPTKTRKPQSTAGESEAIRHGTKTPRPSSFLQTSIPLVLMPKVRRQVRLMASFKNHELPRVRLFNYC